jgi:hypothetical protein
MISWNDRRKAKKAASATTKAQLGAMAKTGTLRAAPKRSTADKFASTGADERRAVKDTARSVGFEAGNDPYARGKNYKIAAKRVSDNPEKYHLTDKEPMRANPKKAK